MSEECRCGFEAENSAGLSAHQRYCEEYQEAEGSSSDSDEDAATVSTAEAEPVSVDLSQDDEYEFDGVEAAAFERDDEMCASCEAVSGLTIHRYEEGSDALANLVTLCEDCDEALTGLHYRTKRTIVNE